MRDVCVWFDGSGWHRLTNSGRAVVQSCWASKGQVQGRGRLPAAKQSTSTSMSGARADPTPPSSAESRKRRAAAPPFRPPRRAVAPPFGSLGVHPSSAGQPRRHSRPPAYHAAAHLRRVYILCARPLPEVRLRSPGSPLALHVPRSMSHTAHCTLHTPQLTPHLTCTQPCFAWACKGKGEPGDTRGHSATVCSGGRPQPGHSCQPYGHNGQTPAHPPRETAKTRRN